MRLETPNISQIYGSARLGSLNTKVDAFGSAYTAYSDVITTHAIGDRNYELSNHLGNFNDTWLSPKESLSGINPDWSHSGISGVLTVISDKLHSVDDGNGAVASYPEFLGTSTADLVMSCDYSPFGVTLEGRGVEGSYRYRFQGEEMDDEIKGEGNSVNYKYRMHDPRVGRFFAVDPLAAVYSYNSTYAFSENRLIDGVEFEGLEFSKRINLGEVYSSLKDLEGNPVLIHQGSAGTCAMAACTYIWIKNDFESFSMAVYGLYWHGYAQVNNVLIKPDKDIFWIHPNNSRHSTKEWEKESGRELDADWIILSSLENAINKRSFLGLKKPGPNSDAGSNLYTTAGFMKKILDMKHVNVKYFSNKESGESRMNSIRSYFGAGYDVVLSIDTYLLDGRIGRHQVNFLGNFIENEDGTIQFDVQTWGGKMTITTTYEEISQYVYGRAVGKAPEKKDNE